MKNEKKKQENELIMKNEISKKKKRGNIENMKNAKSSKIPLCFWLHARQQKACDMSRDDGCMLTGILHDHERSRKVGSKR